MFNTKSVMTLGVLVSALFCYSTLLAAETAPAPAPAKTPKRMMPKVEPVKVLDMTDTLIGTGAEAVAGKTVTIHYTGWLYSYFKPEHKGTQYDSSVGRGPKTFALGADLVIKGWDQGIAGMKVGGKRTLIVPSDLAYGDKGFGRGMVPKNSPLVFDVELLDVR